MAIMSRVVYLLPLSLSFPFLYAHHPFWVDKAKAAVNPSEQRDSMSMQHKVNPALDRSPGIKIL